MRSDMQLVRAPTSSFASGNEPARLHNLCLQPRTDWTQTSLRPAQKVGIIPLETIDLSREEPTIATTKRTDERSVVHARRSGGVHEGDRRAE